MKTKVNYASGAIKRYDKCDIMYENHGSNSYTFYLFRNDELLIAKIRYTTEYPDYVADVLHKKFIAKEIEFVEVKRA